MKVCIASFGLSVFSTFLKSEFNICELFYKIFIRHSPEPIFEKAVSWISWNIKNSLLDMTNMASEKFKISKILFKFFFKKFFIFFLFYRKFLAFSQNSLKKILKCPKLPEISRNFSKNFQKIGSGPHINS